MDEKFPDRIDSKFRYVLLASNRAEQLMRGARSKYESESGKLTSVAMLEITDDQVDWGYGPAPTPEEALSVATTALEEATKEEEEEVH